MSPALPDAQDAVSSALLDERALSKLRWRCRRGLLENDLFIERFFNRYEKTLTVRQAQGLDDLIDSMQLDTIKKPLIFPHPNGYKVTKKLHAQC